MAATSQPLLSLPMSLHHSNSPNAPIIFATCNQDSDNGEGHCYLAIKNNNAVVHVPFPSILLWFMQSPPFSRKSPVKLHKHIQTPAELQMELDLNFLGIRLLIDVEF